MENEIMEDIVDYAQKKLTAAYGYCGVAEGKSNAMLNSDDGRGKSIVITVTLEDE